MKNIRVEKVVTDASPSIEDSGKVRMGTVSPTFPPVHPSPVKLADNGRVRIGTVSPTFPPARKP